MEQGGGGERLIALPGPGERADGAEIAEKNAAEKAVPADHDFAVRVARGVREVNDVVAGGGDGIAEGGEVEGPGAECASAAAVVTARVGLPGTAVSVRRVRARVPV